LNESPSAIIRIEVSDKFKESMFSLELDKHQINIETSGSDLSGDFIRQCVINLLAVEYGFKPDSLKGTWFAEGCYSYVKRNLNVKIKSKRELMFVSYLTSSKVQLQANSITRFNDLNANGLIQKLYQELSEILVSSILTLPDGKVLLLEYAKNGNVNAMQTNKALNSKVESFAREREAFKNEYAVKAYLADVEREKFPIGKRYSIYFSVLEQNPSLLKSVWPELNSYLDKEYPTINGVVE